MTQTMPNIEIDFQKYLPGLGTFYNYFEILKEHRFIHDIQVVSAEGNPMLRVLRNEDLNLF